MGGVFIGLAGILYGMVQIYAGFKGIQVWWGPWWAVGALLLAFGLRITLPLTVGAFWCAWQVWEWHWALAALFVAPGLLFMVPSLLLAMLEAISGLFRRKPAP